MHTLAQRVLSHIRRQELLAAGDRVGVAVSGGIDSVALLRLLLELRGELGIVLLVVHFNHKLRGAESDADERFVADLAREHGLEFYCDEDDVARQAAEEHVSVETAARELRYGFFQYLIVPDEGNGCASGTEAVPFPIRDVPRGPEEPPSHGAAKSRALSKLNKIATGHTLDDQAETVLMRVIRGAGMRGLGGIWPRIAVEDDDGEICGEIVRPLLTTRRRELEQYLKSIGQRWREDSTNADTTPTRNRVRQRVVPVLEKEFNPSVAESLAELAEIARGEEDYWDNEIAGWMGTTVHWSEPEWAREALSPAGFVPIQAIRSESDPDVPVPRSQETRMHGTARPGSATGKERPSQNDSALLLREKIRNSPWLVMNASVNRLWFLGEAIAVQRRLVKGIGEHAGIPLEFKHVEEILRFAGENASGKELSLAHGWKLARKHDELIFLTPDLREEVSEQNYEYELPLPGQAIVYEAGTVIEVRRVPAAEKPEYNSGHFLDAEFLPGSLRVRNWRPGDRFWPARTKSPKKVKELLQERHVTQLERQLWPVVVSGDEIVWVRGFPSPEEFKARPGSDAISIEEKPLPNTRET